jgi:hypothetical protein
MKALSERKQWDLTSTHALEAACEWIRKRSGALMVVAIRVEDSAIAADDDMSAKDLLPRLELEMEYLGCALRAQRAEKAKAKKA